MPETFFSAVNYPLSILVQNIEAGEIALPAIQRPFVWPNARVRDLFDSMYRGFPVGYLLFAPYDAWRSGAAGRGPRLLIVDGQQRLTSIYSVIRGKPVTREDFREERISLAFRPRDGRFEVADSSTRRDPEFIADIGPLLSGQEPQYRFVRSFLERLRAQRPVDDREEEKISSAIYRLYDLPSYSFAVLQLSRSLDEEQVAEVFTRINSRSVPLSRADFVLTLMAVSWEEGRRELEQFCRRTRQQEGSGEPSVFNTILRPTPAQMLPVIAGLGFRRARLQAVYSTLQGRDLTTGEVSEDRRAERFKELEEAQQFALDARNWLDFLEAVRAAGYVSAEMVPSEAVLLSCYTLFLIGRRDYEVEKRALRRVMSKWIFAAMLTGRYAGSADANLEADLARLRGVEGAEDFVSTLEGMLSSSLTEQFWSDELPTQLQTTSTRSPALLSYYAAINVLGATGLGSGTKVSEYFARNASLARRQVYPRRYLARLDARQAAEAGQVANYVLADGSAAMQGSPKEYFPALTAGMDRESLRKTEKWHALPKGWQKMDFPAFLDARRESMSRVVRDAFTLF